MKLIELLQQIKSKLMGFAHDIDIKDIWDKLSLYGITKEQITMFLYKEGVSVQEIVPFLETLGFGLNDILESFIGNGLAYEDRDFIKYMVEKYGTEDVMTAYLDSSLVESKKRRLLNDYFDMTNLPEPEKTAFVKSAESGTVRDIVFNYIKKAYDNASMTELMLVKALEGVKTDTDDTVKAMVKLDCTLSNTAEMVDYLEGLKHE